MSMNRGKEFEQQIKESFEKVGDTSVYRLYDTMGGMSGIANVSDYIIYRYPYQYFIECKTILKGNTLSIHGNDPKRKYGNISNTQWEGLLAMSKIKGVHAGIICWWIEKDVTRYIPIQLLENWRYLGQKSVRYDFEEVGYQDGDKWCPAMDIEGEKKRVFFNYDMNAFFRKFEV